MHTRALTDTTVTIHKAGSHTKVGLNCRRNQTIAQIWQKKLLVPHFSDGNHS